MESLKEGLQFSDCELRFHVVVAYVKFRLLQDEYYIHENGLLLSEGVQ